MGKNKLNIISNTSFTCRHEIWRIVKQVNINWGRNNIVEAWIHDILKQPILISS